MAQSIINARRIALYALWYAAVTFAGVELLNAQELTEEFHQSYPLAPTGRVGVRNVNGNVSVTASDRNEVRVDAIKRARTQEGLREAEIIVDSRSDAIEIRTRYPEQGGSRDGASVNYTISVPRHALLDVKTVNGNVEIGGVDGQVKAGSVNGNVVARQSAGEVNLTTVNGNVEADLNRMEQKPVSLKSVNGNVGVGLPQNAGARLSAKTLHGSIQNDFGVQVHRNEYGPGQDLDTTIGAGGPNVEAKTVNGSIRITRH